MDEMLLKPLQSCPIFHGMSDIEIESVIDASTYHIVRFEKQDVYAMIGHPCRSLDIILQGEMIASMLGPSGKHVKVATLKSGNVMAPAFLFAKNNAIPVLVEAGTKVELLRLSRDNFRSMIDSNEKMRWNFIAMLSNTDAFLADKLYTLSILNVREKLGNMFLEMAEKQGSNTFTLDKSRQEIADEFGIQKFSVIRQLADFQESGAIQVDGKKVTILHPGLLRFDGSEPSHSAERDKD
jgi:CRP-like cAMP-binding protein